MLRVNAVLTGTGIWPTILSRRLSEYNQLGAEMGKSGKIELVDGDITELKVDAIVNAAHESLLGGGGVDAAIHRKAGPELLAYCKKLNGCPTGEARVTGGYGTPAKLLIHTVGPVWRGGEMNERQLLASCYRESMRLAAACKAETIAFPAISTGAYRFPQELAAEIAARTVVDELNTHGSVESVTFCCFGSASLHAHKTALDKLDYSYGYAS